MYKNVIEIIKKDKTSGEVKDQLEVENTITHGGVRRMLRNEGRSILASATDARSIDYYIQVSGVDAESVINEATYNPRDVTRDFIVNAVPINGVVQPVLTKNTVDQYTEVEFNGRINPPSSGTREINCVQLGGSDRVNNDGELFPSFAVVLETPCSQSDTEILDIFYRVRIVKNPNYANDYYWASMNVGRFHTEYYDDAENELSSRFGDADSPYYAQLLTYGIPSGNIRDKMPVSVDSPSGNVDRGSENFNYNISQLTKVKTDYSAGLEDEVGRTFNAINFFGIGYTTYNPPYSFTFPVTGRNGRVYGFSHKILPDDINPLQSQFLHSSSAIRPYLDPSFLGNGQGDIAFDATNWDEEKCIQYRLYFTTGGDVGTAEYKLYKKTVFGYINNEYIDEIGSSKYLLLVPGVQDVTENASPRYPATYFNSSDDYWIEGDTSQFMHHNKGIENFQFPNVMTLDDERVLQFDIEGLSVINVFGDDYINIDANSTPSLTTSNLNDVVVNEINNEIWIATKDAGLFRISSDLNTVTPITVSTGSINDNICYSVDYKNNGDIWAAFDGGLASSTDNGATWTEYNSGTTPQFDFTGISDNNWNQIQGIVVDKDSADDRLLIVKQGDKTTSTIIWWSRAGSTTSSDAVDSTIPANSQLGDNNREGELYSNTRAFSVTKWVKHFVGSDGVFVLLNNFTSSREGMQNEYRTINFGATSVRASKHIDNDNFRFTVNQKCLIFEKDSSGTFRVLIKGTDSSSFFQSREDFGLYDEDLVEVEDLMDYTTDISGRTVPNVQSESGYNGQMIAYMGKGIAVEVRDVAIVRRVLGNSDPFGGTVALQTILWDEYGWNGSSWELDNPNSKVVHGTQETLVDGLDVQFSDVGSPNFVLDEYVDIYVFKGIHKDNATEYSYSIPATYRPSEILSDLSQSSVPNSTKGTVTNKELNFITNLTSEDELYQANGLVGRGGFNDKVAFSEIKFEGDFSVSFKTSALGDSIGSANSAFGVLPLSKTGTASTYLSADYTFRFRYKDYYVYLGDQLGNTELQGATPIASKDDIYTIQRTGSTIEFKINGLTIVTETGASTDTMVVMVGFSFEDARTFYDMNIDSYTENGYIIELGDSGSSSGVYDPSFAMVEAYLDPVTSSFTISGADAPVNVDPHVDPVAGGVTLLSKSGWVKFNSADAGSAITGEYQVLYDFK